MSQAKPGDKVRLHYTGTLTDGTEFDSSAGRDPLEFTLGSGQIIPGLDLAVTGMTVGDKKQVNIPCAEAYGERDPARQQTVPRSQIPPEVPTEPGTRLQLQAPDGQAVPVVVAEATETEITLDANHPLAGEDLIFDVELVEIV
ncbi:MAG: peptidylprolyl isomerase [Rhodobacteraceae bacterium]|nr:peptidylprolyl isomerase [Paracoccaceae bacterium]